MKVNLNRTESAPSVASRPTKPAAKTTSSSESDFQASAKLALKLTATPETRTEQIARAKALIADPNYPNAQTINQVADRLAGRIKSSATQE